MGVFETSRPESIMAAFARRLGLQFVTASAANHYTVNRFVELAALKPTNAGSGAWLAHRQRTLTNSASA